MIDTAMLQQHHTLSCSHTTETSKHPQQLWCCRTAAAFLACPTAHATACNTLLPHAHKAACSSAAPALLRAIRSQEVLWHGPLDLCDARAFGRRMVKLQGTQRSTEFVQSSTYIPAAKADSPNLCVVPDPNKLHMQASTCMMAST
jgi:hypothetical protein